jgi:hypothetical protein
VREGEGRVDVEVRSSGSEVARPKMGWDVERRAEMLVLRIVDSQHEIMAIGLFACVSACLYSVLSYGLTLLW